MPSKICRCLSKTKTLCELMKSQKKKNRGRETKNWWHEKMQDTQKSKSSTAPGLKRRRKRKIFGIKTG